MLSENVHKSEEILTGNVAAASSFFPMQGAELSLLGINQQAFRLPYATWYLCTTLPYLLVAAVLVQ